MSDRNPDSPGSGARPVDPGTHRLESANHSAASGRKAVVDLEKEQHAGIKIGSCFFGWLTATGMAVLLTALVAAAGTAVGLAADSSASDATDTVSQQADTIGIVGAVILLVIVFVAYYCGGYVAGRMARFDGIKQGLGVWLWALVVAVLVAIIVTVEGAEFDVLRELNSFPRVPLDEGSLTTAGVIAVVSVLAASLVGALLGGLGGMRFHRMVDKTGLGR